MHKVSELLSEMPVHYPEYEECLAAVKFDLGDIEQLKNYASLVDIEFYKLPATLCLFQINDALNNVHLFLSKEINENEIRFQAFHKLKALGFNEWSASDVEVYIKRSLTNPTTTNIFAYKLRTHEQIFFGDNKAQDTVMAIAYSIVKAIQVFSCSNVIQVEHQPPEALNKKRIKNGKVPFFSWRTLHIKEQVINQKIEGAHSTHASPRLHFRRGHIRRLSETKRVWVQQCLVGDKTKGFVGHDYKVHSNGLLRAS